MSNCCANCRYLKKVYREDFSKKQVGETAHYCTFTKKIDFITGESTVIESECERNLKGGCRDFKKSIWGWVKLSLGAKIDSPLSRPPH